MFIQIETVRKNYHEACKLRQFSKETRKKLSQGHLGRKKCVETKKRMGERQLGEKNHMFGRYGELHHNFGKSHSEKSKNKIRETHKRTSIICEYCGKCVPKGLHTRWHGSKCKVLVNAS